MIKLLRFMKPYRPILVLVVVLAFLQAMANLYLPTLFANIVDNGIIKGDTGYIWRTGGIMLLITLAGTIAAVVGIFFSGRDRLWQNHPCQVVYPRVTIFASRVRQREHLLSDYQNHQ